MRIGQCLTGWLGLFLLVLLASCGTSNVGSGGPEQVGDTRGGSGVKLNGFEVIRYNAEGLADSSLNNTIALRQTGQDDLVIAINDANYTSTVAVDVRYNGLSIHPESVVFHGLMGNDSQVLSAQFLGLPGRAGVGQTGLNGYAPASLNGDFATVSFAPGAIRTVSASGDVHHNIDGVGDTKHALPNLTGTSDTTAGTASVMFTAAWQIADGDQNKEVNIADITPIGLFFKKVPSTDWRALPADYDDNNEVNIADITPIGVYFGEATDAYNVEAADDTDGAPRSTIVSPDWGSATPADDKNNPAGTLLTDVFQYWTVAFDGASPFTYAQLALLDTNANGFVRVFVTPTRAGSGTTTGVTASVDLAVGQSVTGPALLTVTDFRIKVTGATGGAGAGDIFDIDNAAGTVQSNAQINATLESISGTYNGEGSGSFTSDPSSFPTGMDQAAYDAAFNAVRDQLEWNVGHNGAAGFRRTSDWATFLTSPNFPITGDPAAGSIFPDDDPESDGSQFTEGTMSVTMIHEGQGAGTYPASATLDVNVLADVTRNFDFDAVTDPAAPVITDVQGDSGPLTEFTMQVDSNFTITMNWGSNGAPADLSTCKLELIQFVDSTAAGDSSKVPDHIPGSVNGDPFDFDYVAGAPTQGGEFTVQDFGGDPPTGVILGILGGVNLQAGAEYHFRFFDGTTWSSVNIPDQTQSTQPPPPAQDLIVVPDVVGTGRNNIQIFYPDPIVRRNPRVLIDITNNTADPIDLLGYNDQLKSSGDEFFIQVVQGQGFFPRITVVEAANPNAIDASTTGLPGIILVTSELQPNRIVAEISALPSVNQQTPTREFAFKLFDKNDLSIGQGTFDKIFLLPDVPNPVAISWGVNAMNRVATDIDTRDFTDHTAEGSTIDSAAPDILWFEFADGWMFDYDYSAIVNNNVNAYLTRISDDQIAAMRLDLRLAGVGAGGTYIAIHVLGDNDFAASPPIDGWPGILDGGQNYTVQLDDPTKPGIEATYADELVVASPAPAPNPD